MPAPIEHQAFGAKLTTLARAVDGVAAARARLQDAPSSVAELALTRAYWQLELAAEALVEAYPVHVELMRGRGTCTS